MRSRRHSRKEHDPSVRGDDLNDVGSVVAGEAAVGARLDGLASQSIWVMHDRRIQGSKANIDHIAVTPGGVRVIVAKR